LQEIVSTVVVVHSTCGKLIELVIVKNVDLESEI
jgi:hypothetical protein